MLEGSVVQNIQLPLFPLLYRHYNDRGEKPVSNSSMISNNVSSRNGQRANIQIPTPVPILLVSERGVG
jgi:hypothetical protein